MVTGSPPRKQFVFVFLIVTCLLPGTRRVVAAVVVFIDRAAAPKYND